MRLLLTGATGFIGRNLLRELAGRHELVAIARNPPEDEHAPDVRWIRQDLRAGLEVGALPDSIDAVVHLAQSKRYREFPDGAADIFGVNVESTLRLLEYARLAGARRFLLASTGGLYGYSYERLVESAPISPLNFYLNSKYVAELLIGNYQEFFTTVVFRFFFVYGPGQRRMLIPTLVDKIRGGETIDVEGAPGLRINPIHVSDAVRVFEPALALERSDVFNVAGDEVVRIEELAALVGEALGVEARARHVEAGREGDLVGDNRRMKDVLGVEPRVGLAEGLAEVTSEARP